MALLKILLDVLGGTQVQLGVVPLDPLPLVLVDLVPGTVRFTVTNPLTRDVALAPIVVTVSGPAAAKVAEPVVVLSNTGPLLAGESMEVAITVTPLEPIMEGEALTVEVTASEVL